jgi:hypothetical protein
MRPRQAPDETAAHLRGPAPAGLAEGMNSLCFRRSACRTDRASSYTSPQTARRWVARPIRASGPAAHERIPLRGSRVYGPRRFSTCAADSDRVRQPRRKAVLGGGSRIHRGA